MKKLKHKANKIFPDDPIRQSSNIWNNNKVKKANKQYNNSNWLEFNFISNFSTSGILVS